jgi:hypothetical protein
MPIIAASVIRVRSTAASIQATATLIGWEE